MTYVAGGTGLASKSGVIEPVHLQMHTNYHTVFDSCIFSTQFEKIDFLIFYFIICRRYNNQWDSTTTKKETELTASYL